MRLSRPERLGWLLVILILTCTFVVPAITPPTPPTNRDGAR